VNCVVRRKKRRHKGVYSELSVFRVALLRIAMYFDNLAFGRLSTPALFRPGVLHEYVWRLFIFSACVDNWQVTKLFFQGCA
jgi:hypothetical protein